MAKKRRTKQEAMFQQRVPFAVRAEARQKLNEWGAEIVARAVEREAEASAFFTGAVTAEARTDRLLQQVRDIEALREQERAQFERDWPIRRVDMGPIVAKEPPKPKKLPIAQPTKRIFNFASD